MEQYEKIILFLGIIIFLFLFLRIYNFFKKNKDTIFKDHKNRREFNAEVISKRHYTENNHNLYYIKFKYLDKEEEFLVNKELYNRVEISQVGQLILKYGYLEDFKC